MNTGNTHVLMVVDGPGIKAQVNSHPVETIPVAPTILSVLGLDPASLTVVQKEGPKYCQVSRHISEATKHHCTEPNGGAGPSALTPLISPCRSQVWDETVEGIGPCVAR